MGRIIIPYTPREVFGPFHNRTERFAIGVAHRRCGKTVACINDLVRRAVLLNREHPPGRFGYIGPQLNQSKDNVWQYLKYYAAPLIRDKNEQDLWVELLNGARVRLYGADNPDRIRGAYFDHVVMDEYADMAPSVWGAIVRPMLADFAGGATFIGTPKGRNSFHEQYEKALDDPTWFTFLLRASETAILPDSELDASKRDMTPEQYLQEFECSFDAAIMGAYYGKDIAELERKGRITEVEAIDAPVHTAWDLGIGDSTAIWFWQAVENEIRIVDHYENHGQAIPHYVAEIEARGYPKGKDFVPHDAKVRSLETGRTRIETLISLGRSPLLVPNHKIMDGINAARLTMPRIWIDATRCKDGVEALRQYRADFDEKTRAFKDTPKHDWTSHTADAFRYLCMAWREQAKPEEKSELPPVKAITDYKAEEMWKFNKRPRDRV